MRVVKRTYETVDLTGTTLAEAVGIAQYAIVNYRDQLYETGTSGGEVSSFLRWWRSYDVSYHLLDDSEFGDDRNRETDGYCVRLVMNCYTDDFTWTLTRYYINMRAEVSSGLAAIEMVVQKEEEPEKTKGHTSFVTVGKIYLDEDDVTSLMGDGKYKD